MERRKGNEVPRQPGFAMGGTLITKGMSTSPKPGEKINNNGEKRKGNQQEENAPPKSLDGHESREKREGGEKKKKQKTSLPKTRLFRMGTVGDRFQERGGV